MGRYRSTFTKADLISAATVGVTAGVAMVLGKYQVQAGERIALGYGDSSGQESAQGRIYMQLKDGTPAILSGTVRISVWSPQDRPLLILGEWRTEQLDTSATDRTKQIPFAEYEYPYEMKEDKKIVLEFISDTTATLNKANSTIVMDIVRTTEG